MEVSGDLTSLGLVQAAAAIAAGEVTSVDLTQAVLAAIRTHAKALNAFLWLDEERALETAASLDKAPRSERGKLHGVPLAHKDMFYSKGRISTCGSRLREDFRPSYTATVIERLEGEGAFAIGGLNMAEFAMNATGHNEYFGHCRNPWNRDYCPGGSSSGSGAAVAARLVYASLGSDTGGSVRLPSSMCGVTGLKPTQTRVSRHGVMPLAFSADNVGPLARSAQDCARMLSVVAGADPRDTTSSSEPVPDYEEALDGDLRGLKVGVPENYFLDGVSPDIMRAFEEALKVLEGRGAVLRRVTIPEMDAVVAYCNLLSRVEGATIHAQWMRSRPQDYGVPLNSRLYANLAVPAAAYVEALSRRGPVLRSVCRAVFTEVDVFVAPTIRIQVPTLAATDIAAGTGNAMDVFSPMSLNAVSSNTRPMNYLGLPSLSAPCGFDDNGMPVGLQIQGRPFSEARLLKIADAFQRDTSHHRKVPPMITA
ncbi:amidase (plasmid) [Bosea sp. F3-2]|nr:amidase [Bosea sp. F3-2]